MIDIENLQEQFRSIYGTDGIAYSAPGRINLIGEHTDYNEGFVFPGAIDKGISAVIIPNGTTQVNLHAADLQIGCTFDISDTKGPNSIHFRYVYGVAQELISNGVKVSGFDAIYGGDVPLGAGLSSSAALECCFAYALNDMFGNGSLDKLQLAKIGQTTEHKYVGVKCGIMDQFISMHGKENSLIRLDCRNGEFRYFPWNPTNYKLLLIDSRVKHELVGSPYNKRRQSCERVAQAAGVRSLRECTWDQLESIRPLVEEEDYRRARYVLGEAERVLTTCNALEQNDYHTVGEQMYLTHDGLSKDYEVSCDELDFLVDQARKHGIAGSRMMGGGFGGCTINLVQEELYDSFIESISHSYQQAYGISCKPIPVVISDGAHKLT